MNTQTENMGIPNGKFGTWVFLGGELLIFGGLIVSYILFRLHHPDWHEHAAHTISYIGLFNTLVLLTSSLTMVLAFKSVDEKDYIKASNQMFMTIGLGLLFLCVKAYEYNHEFHMGFTPVTNLFWSFYFLMTGLHAFHILAGLVVIFAFALRVRKGKSLASVEYVGLYWHLVDIIWIFLFPLVYIAS